MAYGTNKGIASWVGRGVSADSAQTCGRKLCRSRQDWLDCVCAWRSRRSRPSPKRAGVFRLENKTAFRGLSCDHDLVTKVQNQDNNKSRTTKNERLKQTNKQIYTQGSGLSCFIIDSGSEFSFQVESSAESCFAIVVFNT